MVDPYPLHSPIDLILDGDDTLLAGVLSHRSVIMLILVLI